MQKSILVSLVTIGLLASVIGVGTYAFFSDTETSEGNTIGAGTLDLWVNGGDLDSQEVTKLIALEDLKPSLVQETADITLKIIDNPGKLYKMITNVECFQANQTEPEVDEETAYPGRAEWKFTDYTWFDMKINGQTYVPDGLVKVGELAGKWIYLGEFQPMTNVVIKQSFHLDADVTNWAQGDVCQFDEVFMVRQVNAPRMSPLPWQPAPVQEVD